MLIATIHGAEGLIVWEGPYRDFEETNRDALSVSDFCILWATGELAVGGGAAPAYTVTLWADDPLTPA